MDKYDIKDLIAASVNEKPNDFENIFNDIISSRIGDAVEMKKQEVAQSMFNGSQEESEE